MAPPLRYGFPAAQLSPNSSQRSGCNLDCSISMLWSRNICKHASKQTYSNRFMYMRLCMPAYIHTYRRHWQTDSQVDRQTGTQTHARPHTHTHTHTHKYMTLSHPYCCVHLQSDRDGHLHFDYISDAHPAEQARNAPNPPNPEAPHPQLSEESHSWNPGTSALRLTCFRLEGLRV